MDIVSDQRPSHELSDSEIVAYLVQRIRAQEMTRVQQVLAECDRLFPDLDSMRKRDCIRKLAGVLS